MDIGKASNFERYIYHLTGNDSEMLNQLWDAIGTTGRFEFNDYATAVKASGFCSGRSTHSDRLATIKKTYEQFNDFIDPHTADGVFVANQYRQQQRLGDNELVICLETALPAKFEQTLTEALGQTPPRPKGYEAIEQAEKYVMVTENDPMAVRKIVEQHG